MAAARPRKSVTNGKGRHGLVAKANRRRGPKPAAQLLRPDFPFTMCLPDGRVLFVEVPGRWTTEDRDGSVALLPDAVRFLDRLQALAMSALDRPPSPGYITSLREGLGLTQKDSASGSASIR